MIISLMLLVSNSALVAGKLPAGADLPAGGFVKARMEGVHRLADDGVRLGRSSEEWPYAL